MSMSVCSNSENNFSVSTKCYQTPIYLFSNIPTAILSPEDVVKDEPSTSDSKPVTPPPTLSSVNPADTCEEKIEPSENDFDLEPAEPAELTELTEPIPTEATDINPEPIAQSEENLETNEAPPTTPNDG